jgi:hypothetical protein
VTEHSRTTIDAAAAVPPDVRENIRQLSGCAIAWPQISRAVRLPVEVCRCLCNLPPSPKPDAKPALPWSDAARQGRLFN